jgi:hypothetical protein
VLLGIAEIETVTFTPDGLFMQLLFDDGVAVVRRGAGLNDTTASNTVMEGL